MLSENQLIEIARRVAARLKRNGSKVEFRDLVNEAYIAAAEHSQCERVAAFWAYKIAARLAFGTDRKHGTNKLKDIQYVDISLQRETVNVADILDLLSVLDNPNCNLSMTERLWLYHHYIENMSMQDIAHYYKRDHSTISKGITSAKEKLKLLLQ